MKLKTNELQKALEQLYRRRQFGIKLGLDPVRRMCELLGNPQNQYGVLHVAGSNGKGSVCAMMASILQAKGIAVGLYTSPHLVRFNERIQINGEELSDQALYEALKSCEEAADKVHKEQGHEATFFEITTVLAFECFRRANIQIAVIETGLGGRLDATNVVMPLISVITPVSREHTSHLGDTLEAIAAEKAGIIKNGRPVVVAHQEEGAQEVIRAIAAESKSPLILAEEAVTVGKVSGDLHGQKIRITSAGGIGTTASLPLIGRHQLENAAVAVATIERLFDILQIEIEPCIIKQGLENVVWPGRCQLLREHPPVIMDAAHNPSGAKELVKVLRDNGIKHIGMILGMCGDKDVKSVIRELACVVRKVWVVPIANERSMSPRELAEIARSFGLDASVMKSPQEAFPIAEKWAKENSLPLVITGSLFLLGEMTST